MNLSVMKIFILILALCNSGCYYSSGVILSSKATAACATAGAIVSSKDNITKKYKRKDCPVCKGKGWYISGDKIKRIECQYCEPDEGSKKSNDKRSTIILRR